MEMTVTEMVTDCLWITKMSIFAWKLVKNMFLVIDENMRLCLYIRTLEWLISKETLVVNMTIKDFGMFWIKTQAPILAQDLTGKFFKQKPAKTFCFSKMKNFGKISFETIKNFQ